MKIKNKLAILFASLVVSTAAFAQSADRLTDIIGTEKVTYGQVAYLACTSMGIVADKASYEDALNMFKDAGVIKNDVEATKPITLDKIALIFSKTWKVKPVLFNMMFKNSARYAFRTFQANDLIAGNDDPKKLSTGHEVLFIVADCTGSFETYETIPDLRVVDAKD